MQDFPKLRELNLKETKQKIKSSITEDIILIQAIHSLDELIKTLNYLIESLREYYTYYLPEISNKIKDNETFIKTIQEDKKTLLEKYKIKEPFGKDLKNKDLEILNSLVREITNLYNLKENLTNYIENLVKKISPNLSKEATPLIAARLISIAGSLKNLAFMPSSKIQVLGAERSLFMHLTKKTKPPKYGILFQHPLIQKSKEKGKTARQLAAKISIAVKKDYFRK